MAKQRVRPEKTYPPLRAAVALTVLLELRLLDASVPRGVFWCAFSIWIGVIRSDSNLVDHWRHLYLSVLDDYPRDVAFSDRPAAADAPDGPNR